MKIVREAKSKLPVEDSCSSCESVVELEIRDFSIVDYGGIYLQWVCPVCGKHNQIYEGSDLIDNRIVEEVFASQKRTSVGQRLLDWLSGKEIRYD